MIRRLLIALVALGLVIGAAGCGRKSDPENPEDEKISYPRQYPR